MFKGAASLILQILLIVAGVILFSYLDPFGVLAPKKKTLQDTPITVVSIKEIGQLITAEYYGEVLSSLQDSLIAEIKSVDAKLVKEVSSLNTKYINALRDFYSRKDDSIEVRWYRRRKDLIDYFYNANSSITNDPFYQDMIELVVENNKVGSEGDLLLDIWKQKNINFDNVYGTKCKIDTGKFKLKKEEELEEFKTTRFFKKRQIIAIGRGWVRAGIDFGGFSEQNFKYDKGKKTVYLLGLAPQILNYDINPWFIPEKKVKGFEIIAATNKANDPGSLLKVKESCLNKLKAQAEAGGIIKQAKINAEESLKHFFSLLLGESLERVIIMENSLVEYQKLLLGDSILPKERLLLVDSVLLSLADIDSASALEMTSKLSKVKCNVDSSFVNRFSSLTYRVSEDEIITTEEWKLLKAEMKGGKFSRLDSLWFFPFDGYQSISDSSRSNTFKKLKRSPGLGFWKDSVVFNEDYQLFAKNLDSLKQSIVSNVMSEQRKNAISQSVTFLKKNVKTINVGDSSFNAPAKLEQRFSSLSPK